MRSTRPSIQPSSITVTSIMVSPEVGAILHHIITILYIVKSKWDGLEWRKENVSTLLLSILFILASPSERKRESVRERDRERQRERECEGEERERERMRMSERARLPS